MKLLRQIVENRFFQGFILAVIVFNSVVFGLQTSQPIMANYGDYFSSDALPGFLDYIWAYFKSSKSLLFSLGGDVFSSWWLAALWFYVVFCVTSEIGLSSVDIASMWKGSQFVK